MHRKKVVASDVTRSGAGMPDPWAKPTLPASSESKPTPHLNGAESKEDEEVINDPVAEEMTQPVSEEEAAEGGFGVFLKQQASPAAVPVSAPASVPETTPEVASPNEESQEETAEEEVLTKPSAPLKVERRAGSSFIEKRAQSNSPAPTPAPAPMSASTLQKMKSEGMYRNQYFKDADCFECGHKFKVSRSSRSATCPTCGATIALDDVEVNMPSGDSIKTRGDVLIRKRGQVSAESIQCKDLRCQGILEANVNASGDAIFKASGTMIGQVNCRRFIVEKGSDVTFLNEIHAEEVDVQAKITGSIFSSGSFVIGANGIVYGDVTARSVSIEPGGELNGAMNIVRTQVMPRPVIEEAEKPDEE